MRSASWCRFWRRLSGTSRARSGRFSKSMEPRFRSGTRYGPGLPQILAPHLGELKDLPDVLRVVEGNQVGAIPVLSVQEFNRAAVGMPAPYRCAFDYRES